MSQEKICIPCHQSYPSSFPECPYCFVGSKKVDRTGIEGTFLEMLPDPILAQVAFLAREEKSKIYEVKIQKTNPQNHIVTMNFMNEKDAMEFVKYSFPITEKVGAYPVDFVTESPIAKSLSHALDILDCDEKTVNKGTYARPVFVVKGLDCHELAKSMREMIKIDKEMKQSQIDSGLITKKSKIE